MKIFDGHVNVSENGRWFDTTLNASYEFIVENLDKAGIDRAALLALPGVCSNDFFDQSKIDRKRFWCFGNIDFEDPNHSLDQIRDLDLDGVKIHPRIQRMGMEQLLGSTILEDISNLGKPLMICGWQQSSAVSVSSLSPLFIDNMAKRFPYMKISISHLGGYRFWDAFNVARSNKNVFLDCSYFLKFFSGTSLERDFYSSLPLIDEKVFYGSDFPEVNPLKYLEDFIESTKHLTEASLAKITSTNLEQYMVQGE
jgi:predicted TIM-barrel fold metal-dependent hydrolase